MTLADRVEQASGPDRELDRLIVLVMAPASVERLPGLKPDGSQDGFVDREGVLPRDFAYTASLDAAMMLMPEGWRVREVTQHIELTRWYAQIESPNCVSYSATGVTEVLTRLAAILRAHEQGGEGDE